MFHATLRDGSHVTVDDYRQAYWWLKENTPEDARVMAWWDYGYQVCPCLHPLSEASLALSLFSTPPAWPFFNGLPSKTLEPSPSLAQISGIANRTTIADGNTWNHEHIATLGRCLTAPEDKAHKIVR
jgi:dolichyl-diphosphooligosaccharide--protein glycosyltransferase